MAGLTPPPEEQSFADEPVASRARRNWLRILAFPLVLVALCALTLFLLDTSFGHRLIANRIAAFAPPSGLRITIGRIDGSIYGKARLSDVSLADPQGVFVRVPETELDWRPANWITSGLDIRSLTLRSGTLLRTPHLRPGDPDAPIMPGFDIRIDKLAIERLSVAQDVLGEARQVDLTAGLLIRNGRALIRTQGKFGGEDRLSALLDAEPDRDQFDLKLDYAAPKGGLLASIAGTQQGFQLGIGGAGSWKHWDGALLAHSEGKQLAALQLTNREGTIGLLGLAWPGDQLSGIAAKAAGRVVAIAGHGTLANRKLAGDLNLTGEGLAVQGQGGVDLGANRFEALRLAVQLRAPEALTRRLRLDGARLSATLDGPFRQLTRAGRASRLRRDRHSRTGRAGPWRGPGRIRCSRS